MILGVPRPTTKNPDNVACGSTHAQPGSWLEPVFLGARSACAGVARLGRRLNLHVPPIPQLVEEGQALAFEAKPCETPVGIGEAPLGLVAMLEEEASAKIVLQHRPGLQHDR